MSKDVKEKINYNDLKDKPTVYKCVHGTATITIEANNDNSIDISKPEGWTKIT